MADPAHIHRPHVHVLPHLRGASLETHSQEPVSQTHKSDPSQPMTRKNRPHVNHYFLAGGMDGLGVTLQDETPHFG